MSGNRNLFELQDDESESAMEAETFFNESSQNSVQHPYTPSLNPAFSNLPMYDFPSYMQRTQQQVQQLPINRPIWNSRVVLINFDRPPRDNANSYTSDLENDRIKRPRT